jgi:hypothetical protein
MNRKIDENFKGFKWKSLEKKGDYLNNLPAC